MPPLNLSNLLRTRSLFLFRFRRPLSTQQPSPSPRPRLEKINARLPRFLHRYTTPLLTAPVSHVSAFLILHEITAVVPLFALAGFFHYSQWMPPFISEGKWVADGVEKFGNYFRKKGWIGGVPAVGEDGKEGKRGKTGVWWSRGEGSVRIVVEFATAYAITKALLPLRLIISVWATPWFARFSTIPVINLAKRLFRRKKPVAPAASTGAVAAGIVPKSIPK